MTPLSLSQAIRIGAMLTPQRRGGEMDGTGTCALGAACDAAGITAQRVPYCSTPIINYAALSARWPILDRPVTVPDTTCVEPLYVVIYTLNDCYRWTREEIAAFVAKVEQIADQEPVSEAGIPSVDEESTASLIGEIDEVIL